MSNIQPNVITSGLQPHSVGSLYPVIIVGRGINPVSWEVHLGKHFCPKLTHSAAEELAGKIADVYHAQGWEAAVRALTAWNIKINLNS